MDILQELAKQYRDREQKTAENAETVQEFIGGKSSSAKIAEVLEGADPTFLQSLSFDTRKKLTTALEQNAHELEGTQAIGGFGDEPSPIIGRLKDQAERLKRVEKDEQALRYADEVDGPSIFNRSSESQERFGDRGR